MAYPSKLKDDGNRRYIVDYVSVILLKILDLSDNPIGLQTLSIFINPAHWKLRASVAVSPDHSLKLSHDLTGSFTFLPHCSFEKCSQVRQHDQFCRAPTVPWNDKQPYNH